MELYLLKSTAILAILFVFYKLVLENTSIHNFKRAYLLGSLLASFLIPFITFTSYVEVSPIHSTYTQGASQVALTDAEATVNYWPIVLWTIYGLGVLFFSVKFLRNLFKIIQQIRKNPKYRDRSFINILLSENVIPHTFFSYIFLNKKQFETGKIPTEVLLHEEAHASQKHSLDIIIIEILKIIFWFNPLFYFFKRSIKLNHEFLADEAVLKNGMETSAYQKLLLAFASPNGYGDNLTPQLAHSINYSSMKKRFSIMKTHTSRRSILFRSLLILPLLSFLIYGFSTKEVMTKRAEKAQNTYQVLDEKPLLKVHVIGEKITVNDKETTILNFTAAVDAVTKDWTKKDFKLFSLDIKEENVSDVYLMLIIAAYLKTNLAKQSDYNNDFILGSLEGIPLPPAPPAIYDNVPGPNQPVEHVLAMAKRNAKFLYKSKTISADQAVELLKNNKNMAVRTELKDPMPPMVFIYEKSGNSYDSENNAIEDIQIKIDENSKISLNDKPVALSNLKAEINKLNTDLTIEEKQKYLSANIEVENESLMDLSKEVGNILYTCNLRSWCVSNLQNEREAGLKHIPQNNPMAGKTIEEAEVLLQQQLKELEEFKKSRVNVKKDENNPWTIVKETNNRDKTTEKLPKQE